VGVMERREPSTAMSVRVWLAGMFVLVFFNCAHAAVISELLLHDVGDYPPYVELTLDADDNHPFDFVVMDARPGFERNVLAVFEIDPLANEGVVVLYEGSWSLSHPADTHQSQFVGGLDLQLGGGLAGASRRLVVFDAVTDWLPGAKAPPLDQWAGNPDVPGRSDVVSFAFNCWPAQSLLGEPLLELGDDNAFWRFHNTSVYSNNFVTAIADASLRLDDHHRLDPGLVNAYTTSPEPATGLSLFLVGVIALIRRRCRAG
jgi:hypothetical protein